MVENGMRLLCNLEVFLVLDGKKKFGYDICDSIGIEKCIAQSMIAHGKARFVYVIHHL